MVDPSHGTGWSEFVPSMSLAAIAAGCDSLMIEVHPNPKKALSDGAQSLTFEQFQDLMAKITAMADLMKRR
jgi:3-deoxy-7-phosphoheptulonate synthase